MSARSIVRAHRREQERRSRRATATRRLAAGTAAALSAGAIAAGSAEAATFGVSNLSDSGPGSLRQALADADGAPGADTITFQSGLSGTINVGAQLEAFGDVAIDGPGAATITLDGGDAGRVLYAANDVALSVSGLTLTNGAVPGSNKGGAIASYGSLNLDGVTITSSSAYWGGGAFVHGNRVTITGSRLASNSASGYGGGLAADGGGFVINASDLVTISGSSFSGNTAVEAGGAIALYDSFVDVVVDSTTVSGNTVTGTASAYNNGGGIWFEDTYYGSKTIVSNSTVSGNSTADAGGGVSFSEDFYGEAGVVNSTITGNDAGTGGGIQFGDQSSVPFTLTDSTVTGNEAVNGGGVQRGLISYSSDSPLDVSSSIVAANTASGTDPDFYEIPSTTGTLTIGNALLGDVSGVTYTPDPVGSNIVGANPQLGPLTNNGGPTETMLPAPTSPAINAGLANGLTTDQRGDARTVAYPGVPNSHGSDGTDIGAAELAVPPPPPPPPPPPDNEITDPFLEIESPQVEGKEKVKVKVTAGAGELVNAEVWGKIFVGKGNAVMKSTKVAVSSGQRATITVVPKKKKATRRILKALANGRKVTAKLTGKLADAAGNEYSKDLQARLKPKG